MHILVNNIGRIIEASVGQCGSSGDSTVWKEQPLFKALQAVFEVGGVRPDDFSLRTMTSLSAIRHMHCGHTRYHRSMLRRQRRQREITSISFKDKLEE